MKVNKGELGYLQSIKKKEYIRLAIHCVIIVACLVTGYITTGSKLNVYTIIAVLSCLPGAKTLVGVIVKAPFKNFDTKQAEEVLQKSSHLTHSFDMIITSQEKIMGIDALVISGNTICGYISNEKTDLEYTTKYLKKVLAQNGYDKMGIKFFNNYKQFLARAEGLESIEAIELRNLPEEEQKIKDIILIYCM